MISTHSSISIINKDKTVESIYCHWDGYLSGVGKVLLEKYNTEDKVRELLSNGAASSICGEEEFYGDQPSTKHESVQEFIEGDNLEEYNYFFNTEQGTWKWYNRKTRKFLLLTTYWTNKR